MTAKVRVALFVAVSLVLSGTAIGQTTPRLTSKQKKERIKALPDEERKWLTEYVEPIILPEEENLFLQLTQPHQWEMFKAEFWKRRELSGLPSPYGPGYQLRYERFRDLAATEYDGLVSDAGRTVVRLGEPAGIENLSSCGGFRQPEVWSYQSSRGSSNLVRHLFYRPSFGAPRKLWTQGDRGIFEDSRVTGFDQLCAISQNAGSCSCDLAHIAPIILPEEEKVFLELTEPYQREAFKQEFWARREKPNLPPPLGPGYKTRYEELRRLADEKYDGWREDAGRMVLRYGEPASVNNLANCSQIFRGLEIWTYESLGATGRGRATHIFYRPNSAGPRKLWRVGTRNEDVFVPVACRQSFASLSGDCHPHVGDRCTPPVCAQACEVFTAWSEISARQGSEAGAVAEMAKIFQAEPISTEGLGEFKNRFAISDPNAKKLNLEGPSGQTGPAAQASKSSTPAPTRRKLSGKEVKELTARLEQKYKEWLQAVDMIITDDERQVFLQIGDNYQKDKFIETFWKRRSIDAHGLRTDFQRVYLQRIETAKEQFKNLNNDRAKVFVINGPPDAVIPIDCQDIYVPIQIWFYERIESLKSKVYLIFYQPYSIGEYKMWLPLDGQGVLEVGGNSSAVGRMPGRRVDVTRCTEWRTLQQAIAYTTAVLGSGAMAMVGASKLFQPPSVETEGVDQILTMTTDLAAGSVPLGLVKLVRFPEMRSNKI